jgi:murein DD-endopeptidase MepM/ murein hydrolase activator NlpD
MATLTGTLIMKNIVKKTFYLPQFLRVFNSFLTLAWILAGTCSWADVYSFVNEDGVICFTDTPKVRGAARIYRDGKGIGRRSFKKVTSARYKSGRDISLECNPMSGVPSAEMSLPVDGRVSSTVGLRHDPIDGLVKFHNGVDIAVPEGTPVKPIAPGTVYFSGARGGYGNMVIISHDDGMITIYAHNSLLLMKEGERVGKETTIALSGSTGRSTGPHLHFEAWKNGINLTEEFLGQMPASEGALVEAHPDHDNVRRSLQADGSILFTNMP